MKSFQNGDHGQEPLDAAHTGLVSNVGFGVHPWRWEAGSESLLCGCKTFPGASHPVHLIFAQGVLNG